MFFFRHFFDVPRLNLNEAGNEITSTLFCRKMPKKKKNKIAEIFAIGNLKFFLKLANFVLSGFAASVSFEGFKKLGKNGQSNVQWACWRSHGLVVREVACEAREPGFDSSSDHTFFFSPQA